MAKMDRMIQPPEQIARLFEAKEARRQKLAALPYPEKVKAVVRLQEMAAPVFRRRGRVFHVWKIEK